MKPSFLFIAFPVVYLYKEIAGLISFVNKHSYSNIENYVQLITAQSIIVLGALLLTGVFVYLNINVSKKRVFVKKNHQIMSYAGTAIFVCAVVATSFLTRNNLTNLATLPITLHISGAIFVFISYIFKVGIKLQREQDLTI